MSHLFNDNDSLLFQILPWALLMAVMPGMMLLSALPFGAGPAEEPIHVAQAQAAPVTAQEALIEELLSRVNELEHNIDTNMNNTGTFQPHYPKEPKISMPKSFAGRKDESRAFIQKCDNVFRVQPQSYSTDDSKIAFVQNLLDGEAYLWFQPYLQMDYIDRPLWTKSWNAFKEYFEIQFGDSNIIENSRFKLKSLRQTSSASHYATEFKRYAAFLGWDDAALRQTFFDGLKEDVRYKLLTPQSCATFEELVNEAIKWDDLLFQFRKSPSRITTTRTTYGSSKSTFSNNYNYGRPSNFQSNYQSRPFYQKSTTVQQTTDTPMEVDTLRPRTTMLTTQERQYRVDKNLCFNCGKPGHVSRDCKVPRRTLNSQPRA